LTSYSLRLFSVLGIPVRLHVSYFFFVAVLVVSTSNFLNPTAALYLGTLLVVLFVSTLAHEIGHCLAARGTGGTAESIELWGLGGLAHVDHPHRPRAHLAVALAGVGVNLLLGVIAGTALFLRDGVFPVPALLGGNDLLSMMYGVNVWLAPLNLLPGLPFDGGLAVEALLWKPLGRLRARKVVLVTGTLCGLGLLATGIGTGEFLLTALGVWAIHGCGKAYQALREGDTPDETLFGVHDFSQGYTSLNASEPPPPRVREPRRRIRVQTSETVVPSILSTQERLDALLDRIHSEGLESLSPEDRSFLEDESRRIRAGRPTG
jgi:Zn-dependent protease